MIKSQAIPEVDTLTRIRDLREDHDYTQEYLAKLLHIGQRTYSGYECGKRRIPLDILIDLARVYNVDMNYICGLTNVKRPFPHKKQ
ncbi:MAG: helix-turn-helix transcriptional regulator [Eubacteriales bacterium]|nr:helix-turn-helix transcriptional regulator [Eubacteriales bacterium]